MKFLMVDDVSEKLEYAREILYDNWSASSLLRRCSILRIMWSKFMVMYSSHGLLELFVEFIDIA